MIDEVQRAPGLLLAIKSRVDRDDARGQFLLTGSANLRRIPTVSDALPGRIDYVTLWPFTQGELRGVPENLLTRLFAGEVPRVEAAAVGRAAYAEMLLKGGFPEAQRRTDADRAASSTATSPRSWSGRSTRPRVFTIPPRSAPCSA